MPGIKAAPEGSCSLDAAWKVEVRWWGWGEAVVDEGPPNLCSSMPSEELSMPSERHTPLNSLPCRVERCDHVVPDVPCRVLVQHCADLPIAKSNGDRSALTAGPVPGRFISLVHFGEVFL